MRTLTTTLGRAVFVAGAIVLLCGPAVAQEVASPPDQIVAQAQQQDVQHEPWWRRWFGLHRKPHPPATQTPPATTTPPAATTTTTPPPAPAPAPITTGRLMDKTYFGLHMHHGDTTTPWPQVTFGFLRLWDSYTAWRDLQPARGQWDFSRLDKLVALAGQHGVEVVLTLGNTPTWASARPTEPCAYGTGCYAEPANIADWQTYVRTVATRYKGRIQYYELWNEPNFSGSATQGADFFTGSAAKLVELSAAAYAIIKQVDPGAQVLSPAVMGYYQRIEPFLQAGGGKTFDIFAAHYYTGVAMPEDLQAQSILVELKQFQALLANYGLSGKPVWNTEWGFYHDGSPGALDMQTAAAYTARHLVLGAAGGLDRSALYAWDNKLMGQVDLTTFQLNAQGIAYGAIANWLIGSRLQGCTTISSTTWQCEITRDARRAWVVWNTAGPVAIQASSALPAPIEETVSLDGKATTVGSATQITIGIAPMLLKSDVLAW